MADHYLEQLKAIQREVAAQRDRLDDFIELLDQAVEPPPKAGHPIQSVVLDEYGTVRFHGNALVRYLLDAGRFDMNQLACLPGIDRQDREQFAQLIGYSVSGFGELGYASNAVIREADNAAVELTRGK